jgi:hypothetical protein
VISKITRWWRRRQRSVDVKVLWPACKEAARAQGWSIDAAKVLFEQQIREEPYWYKDFDEERLQRLLSNLR